jgi:hypothetical protein
LRRDIAERRIFWTEKKSGPSLIYSVALVVDSASKPDPSLAVLYDYLRGHLVVKSAGYMPAMSYDPPTIAILRRALDEVLSDSRFYRRKSASALEIAEHLLAQAAAGERDLQRLKSSAFRKLTENIERFPNQAA